MGERELISYTLVSCQSVKGTERSRASRPVLSLVTRSPPRRLGLFNGNGHALDSG